MRSPDSGFTAFPTPTPTFLTVYNSNGTVFGTYSASYPQGYLESVLWYRDGTHTSPVQFDGWRAPTPYYGSKVTKSRPRGTFHRKSSLGGREAVSLNAATAVVDVQETLAFSSLTFSQIRDEYQQRAIMAALSHLDKPSVELSVAFLERRKTADMVSDGIRTIYHQVRNVTRAVRYAKHKGKAVLNTLYRGTLQEWREIPNLWLLWRYGIKPTMLDIYGAVSALEKSDNGTLDRYMVTVRGRAESGDQEWFNSTGKKLYGANLAAGGYTIAVYRDCVARRNVGCRVRMDFRPNSEFYNTLSDLGITNPASTLYEITPFSFMLDWVVSVGDYLRALENVRAWTLRGGTSTAYETGTSVTTAVPKYPYLGDTASAVSTTEGKRFERILLYDVTPSLVLEENPFNLNRLADSLSLMISPLKGAARSRGLRV